MPMMIGHRSDVSQKSKVPERSKKYDHVQSRLSTGLTQQKVRYLTSKQILERRDEVFFRLSKDELSELYEEYEKMDDERVESNRGAETEAGPVVRTYESEAKAEYERPYIIFDVRLPEDYAKCHLLHARSLPQRFLMQDKTHPELYSFKNKDGKLIILYDDRERLVTAAAHQLVHRGFNNVFILSRGILSFADAFPQYIEGDLAALPSPVLTDISKSSQHTKIRRSVIDKTTSTAHNTRAILASSSRRRIGPTSARSLQSSSHDDANNNDHLGSRFSDLSVADSVISRCTNRKSRI